MNKKSKVVMLFAGALALTTVAFAAWFLGSKNPETPAGYVGYLTQGAVFGKAKFYGMQVGPSSPGRTWLLSATNTSITPYTYDEKFIGNEAVLSKDNLQIEFQLHVVWKVRNDTEQVRKFIEKYSTLYDDKNPDKIVKEAYENFLHEPLRTYARDEVQRMNGMEVKDKIVQTGESVLARARKLTDGTPFEVTSVVVGNIQYPPVVAKAVADKLAATQLLEQKKTEIQIEEREKQKRIVQAEGIAKAMEIVRQKLTTLYLQHEAIEAQKAMVNSPNHTTVYIPVGNMGVPMVGTFDASSGTSRQAESKDESEVKNDNKK